MTVRPMPAPRTATLETGQEGPEGDADSAAGATPEYTTVYHVRTARHSPESLLSSPDLAALLRLLYWLFYGARSWPSSLPCMLWRPAAARGELELGARGSTPWDAAAGK